MLHFVISIIISPHRLARTISDAELTSCGRVVIEERAADLQGEGPGGRIQLLKDGEQILGSDKLLRLMFLFLILGCLLYSTWVKTPRPQSRWKPFINTTHSTKHQLPLRSEMLRRFHPIIPKA
ncbi:unnamed protein product [Merluccius merluccius]